MDTDAGKSPIGSIIFKTFFVCFQDCLHVLAHVYIYVYIYICICIYVYMYMCIYVYM